MRASRLICVSVIILIIRIDSGLSNTCCLQKLVNTGTNDARDGRYSYNGTNAALPVFCADECVYTKDGEEASGDLYCFGPGDLDSECVAPGSTLPPDPEEAPSNGGGSGGSNKDTVLVPSGEYYYNSNPGSSNRSVQCGEEISVLTEDRLGKLDLSLVAALSVAAASTAWSTKIKFDRIDGESSGDVQLDHLMGIFASSDTGALYRLQISEPALISSSASTTKLVVKAGDGSDCSGAVQYGQQYGLFTGDQRLDIGTGALWDQASSATRLHLEADA